jgi:FKBP-type peptidyl-prolyl cis-trans isomerase
MVIGERVLKQYGDVNYELMLAGIKAQHKDAETLITLDEAGESLQAQLEKTLATQTEENKSRGADYLKSHAEKEGVQVTESGLQYIVITEGDGVKPKPTDEVTVHYRGTLIDGSEFDSSYSRNAPTSFGVSQVIPGWTEGLQLMSIGSKFLFVIPYELGYGERGAGGSIGPYETLIFEVELLEINS